MLIKIKYYLILLILILPLSLLYLVPEVSASITEKLSNTTFDSDLSSWTTQPSYILNDEFSDTRAAGSVNGTLATDGTNTRTVVDTNSVISVNSGVLDWNSGGAINTDTVHYPSTSRLAGKTLFSKFNFTTGGEGIGWDTNVTGLPTDYFAIYNARTIYIAYSSFAAEVGSALSSGTDYLIAIVQRTNGNMYFIKGGIYTNWTLLYTTSISTTANYPTLYTGPSIADYTADNVRIPTATWLPTPLAYSTFTTNGATATENLGPDSQTTPSLSLTGGTVSSGSLSITPTLGSELFSNNTFDTDTVWTKGTGVTIAGGVASHSSGTSSGISQSTFTSTKWHQIIWDLVSITGGTVTPTFGGGINSSRSYSSAQNEIVTTQRAGGAVAGLTNSSAAISTIDNVYGKELTLSSLFSTVPTSDTDVIADANVTLTSGTQAGLVTNLDSTSSPNNFLIAYHDGTNVKLDKNVGGTYTNLISTATTYSAGATLRVITYHSDANTLKVRVYYNNALVGSEQTVTDAGIISNTIHGMFSTYASNTFDNFTLWARGSDGEYSDAPFEELTATYDTTVKRTGTGSVKLVAGGVDANFLQSANVGTNNPLTFTAYVYTNGSAVTSSDLSLYSDSSVQSTTYTNDGGGWYKLTATITGTNGSANYGVRVKAGKTIYLDDISLTLNLPDPGPKDATIVCSDQSPSSAPTITNVVSGVGGSSLTINFTKASDPVSYYSIEYGTKSGNYQYGASNIGGKDTTNYTVKYLTPGITYYFRIRAGNGCATGPWSTEQKAVVGLPYMSNIQSNTQISSKVQTTQKLDTTTTPNPTATSESSQQQDESKILSFISNIKLPEFKIPNIEFKLPEISLPKLSFNIPKFDFSLPDIAMPKVSIPDLSFISDSYNYTIHLGDKIVFFTKDTLSSGVGLMKGAFVKPQMLATKIGDWFNYSTISFKEIVLDDEPTRISNVTIENLTETSVNIVWDTNHLATTKVNYGETLVYGSDVQFDEKVHRHVVKVDGLKPNTKYYFEVMSMGKNYVYDSHHEFVTSGK